MNIKKQKQFLEKFNRLQKEYKVRLLVSVSPQNLFSRIFKGIIKVTWTATFVDKK